MTVPANSPSPTLPPTTPAIVGQLVIHFVNVECWPPPADAVPAPSETRSSATVAIETSSLRRTTEPIACF